MPGGRLRAALLATVAAPALAISWGYENGDVVFVLYREPKLVAAALGAWLVISAVAWTRPLVLAPTELVSSVRLPAMTVASVFLLWLAATGLWGQVSESYLYELLQYLTLYALLLVLLSWARQDGEVTATVCRGLVASLAVVSVIGLLQLTGTVPFRAPILSPINPGIGAWHPSLMGYKNPAALAVLGQLFLLSHLVVRARTLPSRIGLVVLLAAEIVYVATLRSRTAYMAVGVGAFYLLVLGLMRQPVRRYWREALAAMGILATVFGLVLMSSAGTHELTLSVAGYLKNPTRYLDSDRGTYLRNTLHMVWYRPLGVGLGDWQTFYPVFRLHNRAISFDDSFQVRRAHSDHVQILGETGWAGVVLWTSWLLLLIGGSARDYLRSGELPKLFVSAQLVALTAAMATDYVVELPYNKLQLFLIAFLALAPPSTESLRRSEDTKSARKRQWHHGRPWLVATLITAVALAAAAYHISFLRRVQLSAELTRRYTGTIHRLAEEGRVEVDALRDVLSLGERFDALPGYSKTLHKDYLILGHTALLLGRREEASTWTLRSLELHPYYPNALQLMSRVVADPATAQRWSRAYRHVMDEATSGFHGAYPGLEAGVREPVLPLSE